MTCYMSLLENGRYRCLLDVTFFSILVILVGLIIESCLHLMGEVGFLVISRHRTLRALGLIWVSLFAFPS